MIWFFSANEAMAMQSALENQISDCELYLKEYPLSVAERQQIMNTIKYSKSALQKLAAHSHP